MDIEKLIHERFSVRAYKPTSVEKEKLDKILEAGRIAPTACNNQPQRIRVITDTKELAMVDECTPYRFGAPLVLLVCYDNSKTWHNKFDSTINSGETDSAIVVTQMILQAWDIGIGSCWVQYFDPKKTKEVFNLPDNLTPVTFLPLGYASDDCKTSRNHGNRVPINDLLF